MDITNPHDSATPASPPGDPARPAVLSRRQALIAGGVAAAALSLPVKAQAQNLAGAATTPTRFVDVGGRRLAYRSVGQGKPIVLCQRFLGVLDWWDPGFIDSLAARGFQVVYFDYTGLGQSTGERTYDAVSLAKDAKDLIDALGLRDVVIGGWSIGGIAAQIFLATYGADISHVLLIGTTPPGPLVKTADPIFFSNAADPNRTVEWYTTAFFEPRDAGSRAAAKLSYDRIFARTADRSPDVPLDWALAQLATLPSNPVFPSDAVLAVLKNTTVPILHLGGDRDIIFPVDNWYALNNQLPTLKLITYPRAGHGPQHQNPRMAAEQIATFIRGTRRA